MKKIILILILIASNIIVAQDTCESPEESLEDLNSITKCSIETVKKANKKSTRQISVRISANKIRHLKKRIAKKNIASTLNKVNSAGISEVKTNESAPKINIPKVNIAALSNSLSKDEVRKALRFNSVDNLPAFSNCKGAKKKNQLNCFNTEMIKHIEEHFSYPNEAIIDKIEGKVWVRFIIDKDGNVTNIKTLTPEGGQILSNEAIRVVSKLPKFKPSTKDGKRIAVKYGLPISFSLE